MLLKASGISKSFGPKHVLKGIDLQIDEGDRIGLVGPNGTGKTTLLEIINGQLKPDTGEVDRRTEKVAYLPQLHSSEEDASMDVVLSCDRRRSAIQAKLLAIEDRMGRPEPHDDLNALAQEYADLEQSMHELGGEAQEEKAMELLLSVGLDEACMRKKVTQLSGGERSKVMIARLLMTAEEADVLIMDEPTNHLDMQTVEWLENYLLRFPGAVLVVSHDRYFLDRVVKRVAEIEWGRLIHYKGNYSQFVEKKRLDHERARIEAEKNRRERDRQARIAEEQHVAQWFQGTHKTRLKMLERMEVVEKPREAKDLRLKIKAEERSGKDLLRASDITVKRGGKVVVGHVGLELQVGDRLGVFGPNGAGKTTLLKALAGELPFDGELWTAPGASVGYFAQGQDHLDPEMTAEDVMLSTLGGQERKRARALLALFMLRGTEVERRIGTLSGGERARVALAMLISREHSLLLLDEPTNHLDIMARTAVEVALSEYEGTLVVVSHDRYLLDTVCTMVGEVRNGSITIMPGTYTDFKGAAERRKVVEEAGVYKVVAAFSDWAHGRKLKPGDKVAIAPSEIEEYRWALDTGKLRKAGGSENKHVER
jgi:ATP-binding cassette subfamily F protein 3